MNPLARALQDQGTPLPFRFVPDLELFPGFLVICLAAPNVGKSFLGLNWAVDVVNAGMPVLYHTPDTDYRTQAKRLTALLRGVRIDDVKESAEWLADMDPRYRWSQAALDSSNFEDLVAAEAEYLGEPPALVIVDVANDIRKGEENVGNVRDVFSALHKVARKYHAVIMAMHHVRRGPASDGNVPPHMDDGLYGGEQVAEVVLGLSRTNHALRLDVLKNRAGRAGYYEHLQFIPEMGVIGG